MSNCIAVDSEVLIKAVDAAGLGGIGQPPVTLRVDRIDRNNFAALIADIAEAQIVSGSGEIVREPGKIPLRVIAARAARAITQAEYAAPREIVPGVGGEGDGSAFPEAKRAESHTGCGG